ncbi:MAG: ABC transporter ATP-binding protein [Acidimicrobiales bacterium]
MSAGTVAGTGEATFIDPATGAGLGTARGTMPAPPSNYVPPEDASIAAVGVTKRYGSLLAVNQVDFYVPRGSVYGLIGPNGAGKSTLMSMAASLLLPTAGQILVEGHDPITNPTEVRRKIGYMPDGLGVYEGMNVLEYIEFFAAAYRIPEDEWATLTDSLLELVELEVKRTAEVNSLSRGMKQRLSLARALVHDPALLILDEPASGLDPRARIELRHMIENLNAMGKTILVSSHILSELQEVCTHVGIMEAGHLLASGSPTEILERARAVQRVRAIFEDGSSEEFDLADGLSKAELLRKLVLDDPREVVEFSDISQGLEDVFLTVTQGIVQ